MMNELIKIILELIYKIFFGKREIEAEIDGDVEEFMTLKKDPEYSPIIKDFDVTKKYHNGFIRKLQSITEVVIHHTAGRGTYKTLKKWMIGGERKKQYKKGVALFHIAIDKDGSIYQLGKFTRWFYHSSSGRHDKKTIGIELIHYEGNFTKEQYRSLEYLLFDFFPKMFNNYSRIVAHDYNKNKYSGNRKGCPGNTFDWYLIKNMGKARKLHDNDMIQDCIDFGLPISEQLEQIANINEIIDVK